MPVGERRANGSVLGSNREFLFKFASLKNVPLLFSLQTDPSFFLKFPAKRNPWSQSVSQLDKQNGHLGKPSWAHLKLLKVTEMLLIVSKLMPNHIMTSVNEHLQGVLFTAVTLWTPHFVIYQKYSWNMIQRIQATVHKKSGHLQAMLWTLVQNLCWIS